MEPGFTETAASLTPSADEATPAHHSVLGAVVFFQVAPEFVEMKMALYAVGVGPASELERTNRVPSADAAIAWQ